MAFNQLFLNHLVSAINVVDSRRHLAHHKKTLASIGYPDLFIKKTPQSSNLFGKFSSCFLSNEKALRWHNLSEHKYAFFSIEKFVSLKGWGFDYLDIEAGTGASNQSFKKVDLNESITEAMYSKYDILIDSGTAEHCFNIGKVFENYFHLLKPGGIVLQFIPFLSPNHGFWSINPTAVFDLSSCNPIKITHCGLTAYSSYHDYFDCNGLSIDIDPVRRFGIEVKMNSIILCFFSYKKLSKAIFKFPVQHKYRK